MFAERIAVILSEMRKAYGELKNLAAEKRAAIINGKNDRMISINALEEKTANVIEKLELERQALVRDYLTRGGHDASLTFNTLLKNGHFGETSKKLGDLRNDLMADLREVKALNDENLALINSSRAIINSTLEFIKNRLISNSGGIQKSGQSFGTYTKNSIQSKNNNYVKPSSAPPIDTGLLDFKA